MHDFQAESQKYYVSPNNQKETIIESFMSNMFPNERI